MLFLTNFPFLTEKGQGITIAICNSMIDSDQSEVAVKWNYKTKISFHPILDLKCTKTRMPFLYYHNQLPVLGKGTIVLLLIYEC